MPRALLPHRLEGQPARIFVTHWLPGPVLDRMAEIAVDNLLAALRGEPMPHPVNQP